MNVASVNNTCIQRSKVQDCWEITNMGIFDQEDWDKRWRAVRQVVSREIFGDNTAADCGDTVCIIGYAQVVCLAHFSWWLSSLSLTRKKISCYSDEDICHQLWRAHITLFVQTSDLYLSGHVCRRGLPATLHKITWPKLLHTGPEYRLHLSAKYDYERLKVFLRM
jgi:hypothetical protein